MSDFPRYVVINGTTVIAKKRSMIQALEFANEWVTARREAGQHDASTFVAVVLHDDAQYSGGP